ncbi:MAG: RNA polymerase sigma factor [Patescibacteria group bacterium]|nr:RNA polymerase sigma factor [Patescibacteria group bacterium]MDE2172536.1 RNA polymerase sigma factor [Patescibacteria group bacterium]
MGSKQKQLEEAYREHADALFRFCLFKISDREQAKDLLQETFTRAWQFLSRDGAVDNFKAFLYKIMSNLVIDEYRKRKPVDSLEILHEDGFDPSFDDTDRWIDAIDGTKAVRLLGKIPPPYGEAVFMRYVQELSLGEISAITGERENTIAVHIHRGLEKLKTLFRNEPQPS